MTTFTKSELVSQKEAVILTGGRRTTAVNVRSLLGNILDSVPNLKDGGSVFEAVVGYTSELTNLTNTSFVYKKWVTDYVTNAITGNFLHTTGDESKAGTLTFIDSPIVPAPATPDSAVNKAFVENLVIGLLDDRGNYNPIATSAYPTTGGSGPGGTILKGDLWTIAGLGLNVSVSLSGSNVVSNGDVIRALDDSPGQTGSSWAITEYNWGYVPLSSNLANGRIYVGNASNIATAVLVSGHVIISNTGVTTIGPGVVTNAMLAGGIDLTTKVSGILPSANGGTGFNTYTKGDLIWASNTDTLAKLGIGSVGQTLTVGASNTLTWTTPSGSTYTNGAGITLTGNVFSIGSGAITNTMLAGSIDLTSKVINLLPVANGSTGFTTYLNGDILYGSAGVLAKLGIGANGKILTVVSGLPSWADATFDLATATGILPALKGGTGINNGTSVLRLQNNGDYTLNQSGGTTSVLNFTANTNVTFPTSGTLATTADVAAAVIGLLDDRGNYNPTATSNYPTTGGSGASGAILKGDLWTISGVSGSNAIGGKIVSNGDVIRALQDSPSSSNDAHWAIGENNLGYTPLNSIMTNGYFYLGNVSNIGTLVQMSGDITMTNAGITAIGANKVQSGMIVNGAVTLTTKVSGILPYTNGGTGMNSYGIGDMIIGAPTGGLGAIGVGSVDQVLTAKTVGANVLPQWANLSVNLATQVTGILPLGNGGTGFNTYTKGDLIWASNTNTLAKLGVGSLGQVLTVGASNTLVWSTPSGGGGGVAQTSGGKGNTTVYTLGSIVFQASDQSLIEDNANFNYKLDSKTLNVNNIYVSPSPGVSVTIGGPTFGFDVSGSFHGGQIYTPGDGLRLYTGSRGVVIDSETVALDILSGLFRFNDPNKGAGKTLISNADGVLSMKAGAFALPSVTYANTSVNSTDTNIFTALIPGYTLVNNNDKVVYDFVIGNTGGSAANVAYKVRLNGNTLNNDITLGLNTTSDPITLRVTIRRTSATAVAYTLQYFFSTHTTSLRTMHYGSSSTYDFTVDNTLNIIGNQLTSSRPIAGVEGFGTYYRG